VRLAAEAEERRKQQEEEEVEAQRAEAEEAHREELARRAEESRRLTDLRSIFPNMPPIDPEIAKKVIHTKRPAPAELRKLSAKKGKYLMISSDEEEERAGGSKPKRARKACNQ
jgi:hypothetical protein